jgi:hypothetical protein
MPQIVAVTGVGNVEFPDDYSHDQIKEILDRDYGLPYQRKERIAIGREAAAQPEISPTLEALKQTPYSDTARDLTKGLIGVPEMAVGLADLVSGGYAGKAAEAAGFTPRKWKMDLDASQSPERQAAQQKVFEAKGFVPTVQAMVENPSTILGSAVESAPSMVAGGLVGKLGLAAVSKLGHKAAAWAAGVPAAAVAGGVGEGVVTAGQQAEQIRQETEDKLLNWQQVALALGSGVATGTIGALSGKLAARLGIPKFETAIAHGGWTNPGVKKSLTERIAKGIGGMVTEGLLEELPQSTQEAIAQNIALGKPWDEGVAEQAAQGFVTGAAMGGVAGGFGGGHGSAPATNIQPAPSPQPTPTPAPAPAAAPQPAPPALRPAAPVPAPPLPALSGQVLNTPIQNWQASPGAPHTLAQSPDAFGVGNQVVKLSQAGGGFGSIGTVTAVTGPQVDGNPNPTVTVKFPDGSTRVSGFKEYGFAENFNEAQQQVAAAQGKPFEPGWQAPAPRITPTPLPEKTGSKRVAPLTTSEQLVERISAARAAGDTETARRLAAELDFLGNPPRSVKDIESDLNKAAKPSAAITKARNVFLDPSSTPDQKAAARATMESEKLVQDRKIDALKEELKAHSDEALFNSLDRFLQLELSPKYREDDDKWFAANYSSRDDRGNRNAAAEILVERGFVERGVAEANARIKAETVRPEAAMEARPQAPLGIQREAVVSPEVAAAARAAVGYNPKVPVVQRTEGAREALSGARKTDVSNPALMTPDEYKYHLIRTEGHQSFPKDLREQKAQGEFHKYYLVEAFKQHAPVSARAADRYFWKGTFSEGGPQLPPGYIRSGETYVYAPQNVPLESRLPVQPEGNDALGKTQPVPSIGSGLQNPAGGAAEGAQGEAAKGDVILARTAPKERADINNGTRVTEFRVRKVTPQEQNANWELYGQKPWVVERRTVSADLDTGTVENGEWSPFAQGESRTQAIDDGIADTQYRGAISEDATFKKVVEKANARRDWQAEHDKRLKEAGQAVRNAEENLLNVKEQGNKKYVTALKRANLYEASKLNAADPAKLKLVQEKLKKEWLPKRDAAQVELDKANADYKAVEAEVMPKTPAQSAPAVTPSEQGPSPSSPLSLGQPVHADTRPGLSLKQATAAMNQLGFGGLPQGVELIHRADLVRNGNEVRGWYNPATQKIWLNVAFLRSPEDIRSVFTEEAWHAVQNDPKVEAIVKRLLASLTEEQLAVARETYGQSESDETVRYEALADILEQETFSAEQRGLWAQLWTAIKDAVAKVFGLVNPSWIPVETDARSAIAHALRMAERGVRTNVGAGPIAYSVGAPAESLAVGAAGQSVAAQGEQLYSELERGTAPLAEAAYQRKLFRDAQAELSRLAQLGDGRLRQMQNAPASAQPVPLEGVGVVGSQVVADSTFSDKLTALQVQHNPDNVKAMQEALFFERHAKQVATAREQLAHQRQQIDHYKAISAPANDIARLEATAAENARKLAAAESVTDESGQTSGSRADAIQAAEAVRTDALAKRDALQLDPVQEFFGTGIAKLRDLMAQAQAAAKLIDALRTNETDPEKLAELTRQFERYEQLPVTVQNALKAGVLTEEQRGNVITALQHSFLQFDQAREQMNNLRDNETPGILREIEAAQQKFDAAKNERLEAESVVDAALRAVKGDPALASSVTTAADVDSLLASTAAIAGMAQRLGENLEQNRWLYDYLNGWRTTPGPLVFSNMNASALGISEDVLREVARVAGQSPQFGSAIVALADYAAAKRAQSLPIQLQKIAATAQTNPQQAAAMARSLSNQVTQRVAGATGTQGQQSAKINSLLQRLLALNYGANLFNQTATNPQLVALQQQLAQANAGVREQMWLQSANSQTYVGFGEAGKTPTHAQVTVDTAADPAMKVQTQQKIQRWVNAGHDYIQQYQKLAALHTLDPANNPTPESLGFDGKIARGLAVDLGRIEASALDPAPEASRNKTPWAVRKALMWSWFRQHDMVARMIGGASGTDLRVKLGGWVKGYLNARRIAARFEDITELTAAAVKSHSAQGIGMSLPNYREQVWNPMAHAGREYGSLVKTGYTLPISGQTITAEDIALLKRSNAFEEALRREVTEANQEGGVRFALGGRNFVRPGGYVGDFSTPRHLNNQSKQFISAIGTAYEGGQKFDASTDLSTASSNPVVQFWNNRPDMLVQHVLDSGRTDRVMKLDPLMQQAEKALASMWNSGTPVAVNSLEDLVAQLAPHLPANTGVSPYTYAANHLNGELAQYAKNAAVLSDEQKQDRTSGLTIALSADNDFTKPAAELKLPTALYDYGALTTGERISAQSRANHERLVEYANSLRRAIADLNNRLSSFNRQKITAAEAASEYGGDISELKDAIQILTSVLKDFEAGYSMGDPALSPSRIASEVAKWPVAGVLALPTVSLRNLTQGQLVVYLMERAMGYSGAKMAMWNALRNMPKALARTAYTVANGIAKRVDSDILRAPSKPLEKVVDIMSALVLSPLQGSVFNPSAVRAELAAVSNLGYDTRSGFRDALRQIIADTSVYSTREEAEFAQSNPKLAALRRAALVGAKTVNALLGKIGVENSDQVLNSLNLSAAAAMEARLGQVAQKFGARLAAAGITSIDPSNPATALTPSEWGAFKNAQAAADSLGQIRLFLEGAAGTEGFQLERALLKYYQDTQAGRPARVFTPDQFTAVQRSLLAQMNTSLPTNRSSGAPGSRVLRHILSLQGYPSDAFLKLLSVSLGGTRDRKLAATLGAKLPLMVGIAVMAVLAGAAADGASELWKRKAQGVQSAQSGVLDSDFWTNSDKLVGGAGRFLASNLFYLGDAILGMQNQIQGNRGFDPAGRVFWISLVQAFSNALNTSWQTSKIGTPSDVAQPFIDFASRITPGATELRRVFGDDRQLTVTKQITAAEARAAGIEVPRHGGVPSSGPTTIVRRNLASAVGAMAAAQKSGDTEAYAKAEADARAQIAKLEGYYTKQRMDLGDDEATAKKKAQQAVWRDYQEINPVVAAFGGRRPTAAEVQQVTTSATGQRLEAQQEGIAAWKAGAQALFGQVGSISKEDVAANRSGGGGPAVSSGGARLAATGGGGVGRVSSGRSLGRISMTGGRGIARAKGPRLSLTGTRLPKFSSGLRAPRVKTVRLKRIAITA